MKRKVGDHVASVIPAILEQRRPFRREVIGVIRAAEQDVSITRSRFCRSALLRNARASSSVGKTSADIQRQRRKNVASLQSSEAVCEFFQIREDMLIDEIADRRQRTHVRSQRNRRAEHGVAALIADHHGELAGMSCTFTRPRSLISAMARSLDSNSANCVTSRVLPSE